MAAGYLYGKRYSRAQTIAVIVLSTGVVLAAWSDSLNKVTFPSPSPSSFEIGVSQN